MGLPPYQFYDGGEFALVGVEGNLLEPPIPLFLDGQRVDDPSTPGGDLYGIVEVYDRVPGTNSWPLTFSDIVANGYVRPLVQTAEGGTGAFGTSVVTGPSFRAQGAPLDLIPEMSEADVATGVSNRFSVTGVGSFGGKATLSCARSYPDPEVGRSVITVAYTWTADEAIDLAGGAGGVGFDAMRLVMISSMLADAESGLYDARYLSVEDGAGVRTTLEVDDDVRGVHLFDAPVVTGVGRAFGLLKDHDATWNAGSASVEIIVTALSANVGSVGVQGYLASTTNPNDDSLNAWLEWLDPPDPIPAGTTVSVEFEIVATPPTDIGDVDHDGAMTCADVDLVGALSGLDESDVGFDTYADLDRDGDVDGVDESLLESVAEPAPGDFNADWQLNVLDFVAFQAAFVSGDDSADVSGDGQLNVLDFVVFQALFMLGC